MSIMFSRVVPEGPASKRACRHPQHHFSINGLYPGHERTWQDRVVLGCRYTFGCQVLQVCPLWCAPPLLPAQPSAPRHSPGPHAVSLHKRSRYILPLLLAKSLQGVYVKAPRPADKAPLGAVCAAGRGTLGATAAIEVRRVGGTLFGGAGADTGSCGSDRVSLPVLGKAICNTAEANRDADIALPEASGSLHSHMWSLNLLFTCAGEVAFFQIRGAHAAEGPAVCVSLVGEAARATGCCADGSRTSNACCEAGCSWEASCGAALPSSAWQWNVCVKGCTVGRYKDQAASTDLSTCRG